MMSEVEQEPVVESEEAEDGSVSETGETDSNEEEEPDSAELLRSADLLTPDEGSQIAATGESRLVVWVGERDSGKTTLSAELYERHRNGRAKTDFAGSQTLLGFEERIHPARAESGRITPRTKRTEVDPEGRELLHLSLSSDGNTFDLLLADIPGELFRRIRDHELTPKDVPLLEHADKLAILVDGAWIADPGRRSAATSFARQLIGGLASGDLPGEKMDVAVVLTKLDRVQAAGVAAVAYWQEREAGLLAAAREISPGARVFCTAARGSTDDSDGMDELVAWLTSSPPEPNEPALPPAVPSTARILRIQEPRTEP
jgi:hypothetical protein